MKGLYCASQSLLGGDENDTLFGGRGDDSLETDDPYDLEKFDDYTEHAPKLTEYEIEQGIQYAQYMTLSTEDFKNEIADRDQDRYQSIAEQIEGLGTYATNPNYRDDLATIQEGIDMFYEKEDPRYQSFQKALTPDSMNANQYDTDDINFTDPKTHRDINNAIDFWNSFENEQERANHYSKRGSLISQRNAALQRVSEISAMLDQRKAQNNTLQANTDQTQWGNYSMLSDEALMDELTEITTEVATLNTDLEAYQGVANPEAVPSIAAQEKEYQKTVLEKSIDVGSKVLSLVPAYQGVSMGARIAQYGLKGASIGIQAYNTVTAGQKAADKALNKAYKDQNIDVTDHKAIKAFAVDNPQLMEKVGMAKAITMVTHLTLDETAKAVANKINAVENNGYVLSKTVDQGFSNISDVIKSKALDN